MNIYGSTEVAADALWFDPAAAGWNPAGTSTGASAGASDPYTHWVPAGHPIDGTWAAIVREDGTAVGEAGEVGQLLIGGAGVALGYLGDPERTQERFGVDRGRGRFHFTGDLASWAPRGWVRLHGRADMQVKVRGQRVDLGSLEGLARDHPAVAAAAAWLWGPPGGVQGDARIALYIELRTLRNDAQSRPPALSPLSPPPPAPLAPPADPDHVAADDVRAWLTARAPAAAAPAAVCVLEALPRTPAGKVFRGALQVRFWVTKRVDECPWLDHETRRLNDVSICLVSGARLGGSCLPTGEHSVERFSANLFANSRTCGRRRHRRLHGFHGHYAEPLRWVFGRARAALPRSRPGGSTSVLSSKLLRRGRDLSRGSGPLRRPGHWCAPPACRLIHTNPRAAALRLPLLREPPCGSICAITTKCYCCLFAQCAQTCRLCSTSPRRSSSPARAFSPRSPGRYWTACRPPRRRDPPPATGTREWLHKQEPLFLFLRDRLRGAQRLRTAAATPAVSTLPRSACR